MNFAGAHGTPSRVAVFQTIRKEGDKTVVGPRRGWRFRDGEIERDRDRGGGCEYRGRCVAGEGGGIAGVVLSSVAASVELGTLEGAVVGSTAERAGVTIVALGPVAALGVVADTDLGAIGAVPPALTGVGPRLDQPCSGVGS